MLSAQAPSIWPRGFPVTFPAAISQPISGVTPPILNSYSNFCSPLSNPSKKCSYATLTSSRSDLPGAGVHDRHFLCQACHDPVEVVVGKGRIVGPPHGRRGLTIGGGPFSETLKATEIAERKARLL